MKTEDKSKVLFVDDEQGILDSFKRLFRGTNIRVTTANSGEEGLSCLEKEDFYVVVSDMRMPNMDGATFLTQVAKRWPEIIRILLTGYSDLEAVVAAINEGKIYSYQTKPWDNNTIKLHIEQAVELRKLNDEKKILEEITQKQNEELKDLNQNLEQKVSLRTQELQKTLEKLQKNYDATISMIANLVELRDINLSGRGKEISEKAELIAKKMNLSEQESQSLNYACLLYDLGQVGLPEQLVMKPYFELKKSEKEIVEKAPVIAEYLLMALEPLQEPAKIIRQHRESIDGSGYPDGLKQSDIGNLAQILCILVDYYKLQDGRLVQEKLSHPEAMQFMRTKIGTRYAKETAQIVMTIIEETTEDAKKFVVEQRSIDDLESNMILAKPLLNVQGAVLLPKNHRLTQEQIERLAHYQEEAGKPIFVSIKRRS